MKKQVDVFVQGEGLKDVVLVQVPQDAVLFDVIKAAKEHGLLGGEQDCLIFLEDGDEAIDPGTSLENAGVHNRTHVHIHRQNQISVTVNFNARHDVRDFPPSTTVGHVKKWATKVFEMSEIDATEHVLQVTGSTVRPDEMTHIGALVTCPDNKVSFDLVPKVRVEG